MDTDTQARFAPLIAARRDAIEQELSGLSEDTAAVAPDAAIGRLSRLDSMQMQQMALASKRRLEDERIRLQEAQRRLDGGTYGRCLLCGGDIDLERLEYQPDAVTCVSCLQSRK